MTVRRHAKGFTLVELVIGISVLAIALILLTGTLIPQAQQSTDPWFQVRSAELAQSLMNEINARSYDEKSSRVGGALRCDEAGANSCIDSLPACTNTPTYAWIDPGESSRDLFDDIDDFHCFKATGDTITNIENQALINVYREFGVAVNVQYAGDELGLATKLAKRITVSVTPPRGSVVNYTVYRTNY